jgi:hypothetical protein
MILRNACQRFQRYDSSIPSPQGCVNPGLQLANAFSVIRLMPVNPELPSRYRSRF